MSSDNGQPIVREFWQYRASVRQHGDWTEWTTITDGHALYFSTIKVPYLWEFRKILVVQ